MAQTDFSVAQAVPSVQPMLSVSLASPLSKADNRNSLGCVCVCVLGERKGTSWATEGIPTWCSLW